MSQGHAIVVGASSGIGAGVATELGGRGWSVTGLSRHQGELRARFVACDVTDDASVDRAVARAISEGGVPRALVYSAGAPVGGRTLDVPTTAARAIFEVNHWGMRRVVRAVYPAMADRRDGVVIVVLSIAALRAIPFEADYAASKAAAARWLECFALEAEQANVRVGYLAPGFVDTGFHLRAGWHGMEPVEIQGSGVTASDVAKAISDMVEGRRSRSVFGWRENAIVLADRVTPNAYNRLLRGRIRG